jgi:hypothetical protein
MTAVKFIYSFLIIIAAGRLVFEIPQLKLKDESFGFKAPLYFMVGTIVISIYMFLLFLVKIKYSIFTISAPFAIYSLYYLSKYYKNISQAAERSTDYCNALLKECKNRNNTFFILALIPLTLITVTVFLENLITPIYIGDVVTMWYFKPKAIFMASTIPMDLFTNINYWYSSFTYPLLTSLNVAWVTICMGQWSDTVSKTFYSLSYLATMVFFYTALKRHIKSKLAMIGTFMTFTIPHVIGDITTGYVDLNVAFFGCLAAILLFEWMNETKKMNYLYLAAILIAGAAWTHNEGLMMYGAMTLTILIFLAKQFILKKIKIIDCTRYLLSFLIVYTVLYAPFKTFISSLKLKQLWVQSFWQLFNFIPNIPKAPVILGFICYELFLNTYLWQYFWILFLVFMFMNRKAVMGSNLKYLLLLVIFGFAMIFEAFYVSDFGGIDGMIGLIRLNLDRAMNILPLIAGFLMFASFKDQKD